MKEIALINDLQTGIDFMQPVDNFIAGMRNLQRDLPDIIDAGEMNPLHAAAIIKAMEDTAKHLRGHVMVKDAICTELDRYPEKTVKFGSCTFTKKVVGTKYDYSKCNDPKHIELKTRLDKAAKLLKEREEFLKACPPEGLTTVDDGTGEVTTIYPPVKISEDGYSITINV